MEMWVRAFGEDDTEYDKIADLMEEKRNARSTGKRGEGEEGRKERWERRGAGGKVKRGERWRKEGRRRGKGRRGERDDR